MRSFVSAVAPVAMISIALGGPALAQSNTAAAQALFDAGNALGEKNEWARACPKFEESQRLEPGLGTLYRLADCYEHVGRIATAWGMFIGVADQAQLKGQAERAQEARRRATLLEPKLVYLKIDVPGARGDGFVVKRDGAVIGAGQHGTPVPIDPGTHTIEASAAGKKTWQKRVDVSTANADVAVPELESAVVVDTAPARTGVGAHGVNAPPDRIPGASGSGQRVAGLVVGGVGLVGLGLGALFGANASSSWSSSQSGCSVGPGPCPNHAQAVADHDSAASAATISTIAFLAGGALVVGGLVLFVTAPSRNRASTSSAALRVVPSAGPGGGGVLLRGSF